MKAIILSAGYGTRLRPITEHIPKPLIPIGGMRLLDFHIRNLAVSGVKEIAVNVHHLHGMLEKYIAGLSIKGVKIHVLYEKEILGTGGAIKNAEQVLKDGPFFVVNSDVIFDFDLAAAFAAHERSGAVATMVLKETDVEEYQRVRVEEDGSVSGIGRPEAGEHIKRFLFTGVHVVSPDIFSHIREVRFCCINSDIYRGLISQGIRISSCREKGYWVDVGTPAHYHRTAMDFLEGRLPRVFYERAEGTLYGKKEKNIRPPAFVGTGTDITLAAEIGPGAVVLADVPEGCAVRDAVILPGAVLKKNEKTAGRIIGKDIDITINKKAEQD